MNTRYYFQSGKDVFLTVHNIVWLMHIFNKNRAIQTTFKNIRTISTLRKVDKTKTKL